MSLFQKFSFTTPCGFRIVRTAAFARSCGVPDHAEQKVVALLPAQRRSTYCSGAACATQHDPERLLWSGQLGRLEKTIDQLPFHPGACDCPVSTIVIAASSQRSCSSAATAGLFPQRHSRLSVLGGEVRAMALGQQPERLRRKRQSDCPL